MWQSRILILGFPQVFLKNRKYCSFKSLSDLYASRYFWASIFKSNDGIICLVAALNTTNVEATSMTGSLIRQQLQSKIAVTSPSLASKFPEWLRFFSEVSILSFFEIVVFRFIHFFLTSGGQWQPGHPIMSAKL